jgi:hypothetical protein
MTWWYCADQDNAEKYVWIECERWFDARRTAWQLLHSERLWVTTPKTEKTTPPKKAYTDHLVYEAKWFGSAAGVNDLRLEVKRLLVKKMICSKCLTTHWPWELEPFSGKLVHLASEMSVCGPVIEREKKAPLAQAHAP